MNIFKAHITLPARSPYIRNQNQGKKRYGAKEIQREGLPRTRGGEEVHGAAPVDGGRKGRAAGLPRREVARLVQADRLQGEHEGRRPRLLQVEDQLAAEGGQRETDHKRGI